MYKIRNITTSNNINNALVSNNAPIQPPQAFVDNALTLCNLYDFVRGPGSPILYLVFSLSGKGLTHFDGTLLYQSSPTNGWLYLAQVVQNPGSIDFSDNALPTSDINGILGACVSALNDLGLNAITLDLSGGTNGSPSGQGITDQNTLSDAGWTIGIN